jgi:S-adenosylmethionine:tRNA ribosyltransferase-isomerase
VVVAPLLLHTCGVIGEDGGPLPEPYHVPPVTARLVNHTRSSGGLVLAVGTTVVRALETVAGANGVVRPARGWTELVVTPERGVRAVDGLLSGWHEPGGSHLRLLEAVGGREPLELAYATALEHGFAWGAFGDLHLILPGSRRRARRAPAHR